MIKSQISIGFFFSLKCDLRNSIYFQVSLVLRDPYFCTFEHSLKYDILIS